MDTDELGSNLVFKKNHEMKTEAEEMKKKWWETEDRETEIPNIYAPARTTLKTASPMLLSEPLSSMHFQGAYTFNTPKHAQLWHSLVRDPRRVERD